jgi:hypothetical protein
LALLHLAISAFDGLHGTLNAADANRDRQL